MTDYIKSAQEQATAAWINVINQQRIDELLRALDAQDINLERTLVELQKMKDEIQKLIITNRGGEKGLHGFIAEVAEVGVENARNLIEGLKPVCEWVNDNKDVDIRRNEIDIQQKFVTEFFSLSKNKGVLEHSENYPDFLIKGGKYQIPKNFYETLMKLKTMSQEEASRLSKNSEEAKQGLTYSNWKKVQDFFKNSGISPDDLEPSLFNYDEVQARNIHQTIKNEEKKILETDQNRRNAAHEASKPTLKQGIKISAVSAGLEGGVEFCSSVAKKRKSGKKLSEFTTEDWKEVGIDTGTSTIKGGIRAATVYTLSNFTATPANVATGLVTATFGVTAQAKLLHEGKIDKEEFLINSEALCLDVSISTISALLGQVVIPLPILGAIIGNVTGMYLYNITKEHGLNQEQLLVEGYQTGMLELIKKLDEQYYALLQLLEENLKKYKSMMELAFDLDINNAFESSIKFARYNEVPEEKILKTKSDIDAFFLA